MTSPAVERVLEALRSLGIEPAGRGPWTCRCPAHDDHRPSLSVSLGQDGRALLKCHAGCTLKAILAVLGLTDRDLFPETNGGAATKPRIVATYPYHDHQGALLYEVVRYDPKDFRQRRPDGNGGWTWSLDDVRRVLYRLPELKGKPAVYVVEGEKDVERLSKLELPATCNPGGAGKWREDYSAQLRAAGVERVAIIPDNDGPGVTHASQVARSCIGAGLQVRILRLDGLPLKGDVSDWLDAEHSEDDLRRLAKAAPIVTMAEIGYQDTEQTGEGAPGVAEPEPHRHPTVAAYQPFPLEVLPDALRAYVEAASSSTLNIDPAYIALPMFAVLAAAIGNTRRLCLTDEPPSRWREPSIIWAVVVAESGSKKSPALDVVLRPVREIQARKMVEAKEAERNYEAARKLYERDLARWKRAKGDGAPPVEPEPPVIERYLVDDTTVEALARLLLENPRGLLLASDELGAWLGAMDQYHSGRSDLPKWTQMFGGRPLIIDRRIGDRRGGWTGRTVYVPRAAVSIAGVIPPRCLTGALTSEHFAGGFAARLLVTMPPRRPGVWRKGCVEETVAAGYESVLKGLWALKPAKSPEGEPPSPENVRLSPEAERIWERFYEAHERELLNLEEDLGAAWSKLEGYCARFALVIHLARRAAGEAVDPTAVDAQSMEAAIALTRWCIGETERVYAALGETPAARDRRKLLELIRRHGGEMTANNLTRYCRRFRGDPEGAAAALAGLARLGYGTWEERPAGPAGGRPTRVFTLTEVSTVYQTPEVSQTVDTCRDQNRIDEGEEEAGQRLAPKCAACGRTMVQTPGAAPRCLACALGGGR